MVGFLEGISTDARKGAKVIMRTLQYLRLRRGWPQDRMGRLLRLNPITVAKLESGELALYPEAIDHLEQRLGVLFGEQWTFAKLMQHVPDLTSGHGPAFHDAAAVSE